VNAPDVPQAASASDDPSRSSSTFINLRISAISSISSSTFLELLRTSYGFPDIPLPSPASFDFRIRRIRSSSSLAFFELPRISSTLLELLLIDSTCLEISQLSNSRDSRDLRASAGRLLHRVSGIDSTMPLDRLSGL
jgi:hypothetical protein